MYKDDPIIGTSQRIESLLRQLGGQGNGMQQLAISLDSKLDQTLRELIKSLNHRRNIAVHDENGSIDPIVFKSDALVIIAKLEAMLNQTSAKLNPGKPSNASGVAGLVIGVGIEAALALRSYLRGFK